MLHLTAYCVVAEESVGRQIPIAFLERVKDDFVSKYGGGKAATATPNSLNKEFGYLILIFQFGDVQWQFQLGNYFIWLQT